jgi:tetratricopeptide (TPR) repeat protein
MAPESSSSVPPAMGSDAPPPDVHKMDMSHTQRLAEAFRLREAGNAAFRGGDFVAAEAAYQTGSGLFTYMHAESPLDSTYATQNDESINAAVPLYNNLALCLHRREAWRECADACTEALDLLPDDRKARVRRGLSRVQLELWEEAEVDFKRALVLDPGSHETRVVVQNARAAIANARRAQNKKDALALAGCFDKLNAPRAADADELNPDMDGVDGGVGGVTRAGLYDASDVAAPNEAFPHAGRRAETPAQIDCVEDELLEIEEDEADEKMLARQHAYNACIARNRAEGQR